MRKFYRKIRWVFIFIWIGFFSFMVISTYLQGAEDWTMGLICLLPAILVAIIWAVEASKYRGLSNAVDEAAASWFARPKNCSKCGWPVPADSKAGQNCPHCGVQWDF